MDKDHFKVSAEVLQKNAMKSTIRDLNAEFQMKGGKVIYKTSKKGDTYQLSHPDSEYLEQFRIRLFKELGLLEEKEVPKELKEKKGPPPRYGEEHKLRRGWNVRSPREFQEGRYNERDRRDTDGHFRKNNRPGRRDFEDKERSNRKRPSGPPRPREFERTKPAQHTGAAEEDEQSKTFEERWGDISEYLEIIKKALESGAVDDGQIIKYAYNSNVEKSKIKTLKKLLWDNRCKGPRNKCPHGKKKFRFEDLMKVCSGKVEGYENIDSPFIQFLDIWKNNMNEMYEPIRDKIVDVQGKISSYKFVDRKDHEHLKILAYDTSVKTKDDGKEYETRKLWIKVSIEDFEKLTAGETVRLEDVVSFRGKCIFDNYFNDYWVVDLEKFSIITPSAEGEAFEIPKAS